MKYIKYLAMTLASLLLTASPAWAESLFSEQLKTDSEFLLFLNIYCGTGFIIALLSLMVGMQIKFTGIDKNGTFLKKLEVLSPYTAIPLLFGISGCFIMAFFGPLLLPFLMTVFSFITVALLLVAFFIV